MPRHRDAHSKVRRALLDERDHQPALRKQRETERRSQPRPGRFLQIRKRKRRLYVGWCVLGIQFFSSLLKPFHGLSRVCGLRLKGPFFLDCLLFMPTQYPLALTSFIGTSSLSDHHAMLRRLAMELIRSPFHNGNEWFGLQSSI